MWTVIRCSVTLRISSSFVGAVIGILQVAPASAQQSDGIGLSPPPKVDLPPADSRADLEVTERSNDPFWLVSHDLLE